MRTSLFIFTICSFLGSQSLAASYRRVVNFEWDPIEGATSYDVELKPFSEEPDDSSGKLDKSSVEKSKLKNFAFNSKKSSWNGKVSPGKYLMRLRSRDYRGVPGSWSPQSEFDVGLDIVAAKSPLNDTKIQTKEDLEQSVTFVWMPVGDANTYNFEILSDDGKFSKIQALESTKLELKIPVANAYTWKISAANKNNIRSEAITSNQFSIIGRPIKEPKLERPLTQFVREIKWEKSDFADTYDVHLFKLDTTNRKWEKLQSFEDLAGESLPFDASWTGGKYQVAVRAKGKLRGNSELKKLTFDVVNGDRSPASEYTALVRTSIDRMNGWFGIASYLVTEITYSGNNPENNSVVSYKARGGTGRIGAGWMSSESTWGFLAIADMSGFILNGKTNTYASTELNAIYRKFVSNRSELRVLSGLYYKELPETIGDPTSINTTGMTQSRDTKISASGPHLGAEYWYSLTPKFGVQANFHLYYSAIKMSTPNGQDLQPAVSTQMGFLGSYRFTTSLTGLMGYARREEKMAYKCQDSTFCSSSESNTSSITGDYLNFFAEWSF